MQSAKFQDLITKAQDLITGHFPARDDNDIMRGEEAIRYIEEALRLNISAEERANGTNYLASIKQVVEAAKGRLSAEAAMRRLNGW